MKKVVSMLMTFLLVLSGCNVDKAKIKNINIKNLEYLSGNYITFDVSIKPNSFEDAKVFLVKKDNYDQDNYGNALHEYKEQIPEGKFTVSYEHYESGLYYLFVTAKGKNLKTYNSNPLEIDLTRAEPTLNVEIVNNFTDNVTIKFTDVENDLNSISYCMVDNASVNNCETPIEVIDYYAVNSVVKDGKNYILFQVTDLIGNNKAFIINLTEN